MMITSNGKQPKEMSLKELKVEKRIQNWLAREFRRIGDLQEYKHKTGMQKIEEEGKEEKIKERYRNGEIDKLSRHGYLISLKNHTRAVQEMAVKSALMRYYEEAVRLFVAEIEDEMEYHKARPKKLKWIKPRVSPYRGSHNKYRHPITKEQIRVQTKKNILKHYETLINRNGNVFQWDKRKLMMVAKDRGYMSEISVAYAIEQELDYPKRAIKTLMDTGKFTWGQVLVIGAMFEMTPKEFCDTFMLGYFVEQGGEWRASFDNIDKNGLLAKAQYIRGHYNKNKDEDGTKTE